MPHIIVECSANIADDIAIDDLLQILHYKVAAHNVEIFKIKARAVFLDHYIVADGAPENSMVHVTLLLLEGRGKDFAKVVGDGLYADLKAHIAAKNIEYCAMTLEIREMDAETYHR